MSAWPGRRSSAATNAAFPPSKRQNGIAAKSSSNPASRTSRAVSLIEARASSHEIDDPSRRTVSGFPDEVCRATRRRATTRMGRSAESATTCRSPATVRPRLPRTPVTASWAAAVAPNTEISQRPTPPSTTSRANVGSASRSPFVKSSSDAPVAARTRTTPGKSRLRVGSPPAIATRSPGPGRSAATQASTSAIETKGRRPGTSNRFVGSEAQKTQRSLQT